MSIPHKRKVRHVHSEHDNRWYGGLPIEPAVAQIDDRDVASRPKEALERRRLLYPLQGAARIVLEFRNSFAATPLSNLLVPVRLV